MNGTATGVLGSTNGSFLLQLITLCGVLTTIGISWSSLNQQRTASARESLEQLDDIEVRRPNAKLKPILHDHNPWPGSESTVKIQTYMQTELANVSRIHSNLLAFPKVIFDDYDVEVVEDGYLIKYDTANAVEIRRRTQELLRELSTVSGSGGYGHHWIDLKNIEESYGYDSPSELFEVHERVLKMLEENAEIDNNAIRKNLEKEGYHLNIAYLVLWDLVQMDRIEEDPNSKNTYQLK